MVEYFFDSYAIVELVKSNPNYSKYLNEVPTFTIFNLAEIYWSILRDFNEKEANEVYEEIKTFVIGIEDDILKEAVKFRLKNKKRNLSYADCIGYITSQRYNLLFLTGDKEFEGIKGVEFVK